MSGSPILIVNADDFGRSPGINAGIIRAHLDGIVSSTTLIVNTPWTGAAVIAARAVPTLGIGLHLNFCYGAPLSAPELVRSLVNTDGHLKTDTRELARVATADDIRTETTAQIERFRVALGRDPTHLDSHKHLHSTASFAPVVASVAAAAGLPVRATSAEDRDVFRSAGAATPDAFEGRFHGLDGEGVEVALLVQIICELQDGVTELMCHPGVVDEHILDSSYSSDRERELAALCSAEVRQAIDRRGITLATFDAVGRSR